MRAILLAGGKGTRISRYIKDLPKCCLPIKNIPLIRITVKILIKNNIKVAVCTGYKNEEVHKALKGLPVQYFNNPFYEKTNSIVSLWFSKSFLTEDTIIMNADVYFDPLILKKLILSKDKCIMAVDSSKFKTGDFIFETDSSGSIIKYGKKIPLEERTSEYVGMAKIRKSFLVKFIKQLDYLIDNNHYDFWWENILYSLSDQKTKIKTLDIAGLFWSEVDYYDEYLRILNHIH